jgi:hypothetical protein
MKRFGKGQMVWVTGRTQGQSGWSTGKLEPARYVRPGDTRGSHVVVQAGRQRVVYTNDIVTKTQKNLEEAEKLLKS